MGCCDNEDSLGLPKGDPGDPGEPGTNGVNGINAYTTSTGDYLQPAVDTTVVVSVADASWISVGQVVFIEGGGYYVVIGTSATTITVAYNSGYTLTNQSITPVGGSIVTGAKVSAAGIKGATGTGLPYLVYTALISQSGTSNPTVTVMLNTIGNIQWNYSTTGVYQGILTGAFTANKTWGCITARTQPGNYFCGIDVSSFNPDFIVVRTQSFTDITMLPAPANGVLNNFPIEIRVYP